MRKKQFVHWKTRENQKRGHKGSEYKEWVATREEKVVSLAGPQTSKRLTACGETQTANQSQEPGQPENVEPKSPRAKRLCYPKLHGKILRAKNNAEKTKLADALL